MTRSSEGPMDIQFVFARAFAPVLAQKRPSLWACRRRSPDAEPGSSDAPHRTFARFDDGSPRLRASRIVPIRAKTALAVSRTKSVNVPAVILAFAIAATASSINIAATTTAEAQTTGAIQRGSSGLPLPRFVSLKSSRVNMRIGPGRDYSVDWLYLKSGLPLEIIQEYDNWRRVRDSEGTEGWIYQSLLSGRRTGMAAPWHKGKKAAVSLRIEPDGSAQEVAMIEPGTIGRIHLCNGDWCEMTFKGHKGWIKQASVWGAYPGETYQD